MHPTECVNVRIHAQLIEKRKDVSFFASGGKWYYLHPSSMLPGRFSAGSDLVNPVPEKFSPPTDRGFVSNGARTPEVNIPVKP